MIDALEQIQSDFDNIDAESERETLLRKQWRDTMREYRANMSSAEKEKLLVAQRTIDRAYRKWALGLKLGKPCACCGYVCTYDNYPAFAWDHMPGYVKSFEISKAVRRSRRLVLAEIKKCQLLCANCHAIVTYTRRYGSLSNGENDG